MPRPEPITINNIPIKRSSSVKLLGVDIDDKLSWKPHINSLQKKLASATFMLRKIKSKINTSTALLIYDSIFCHLNYATIIWGNLCPSICAPLNALIKHSLRCCLSLKIGSNYTKTSELFEVTNKLQLQDIYSIHVASVIDKFFDTINQLPVYLSKMFQPIDIIHQHVTRLTDRLDLHNPSCSSKIRKSTIWITGPEIWNKIPNTIKLSSSFPVFKKSFKHH